MEKLKIVFTTLLKEESGQDLIEYALVAGLIGLGAIVAMRGLSTQITAAFTAVGSSLASATRLAKSPAA